MLGHQSQRVLREFSEMATAARTRTVEMKNKMKELQRVLMKGEKELKVTDAKIKKLKQEQVSLKGRLNSLAKKLK
jgi:hypothetical protein